MIDKIEIRVNDVGHFVLNIGDINVSTTPYWQEVMYLVKDGIKKLGYFPQPNPFQIPPVSWEELNKDVVKRKK